MVNSNMTLRFPRTYREATGMEFYADSDRDTGDKLAAWIVCMGLFFIVGYAFGAMGAA